MKIVFFIILLVLSCQTVQTPLEKPKEYTDVVKDVNREMETVKQDETVKQNPVLQSKVYSLQSQINKLTISLKESEQYGKESYQKYLDSMETVKNSQKIIEKKDNQIKEIEEELSTWRKIKYTIYAILGIGILIFLIRLFYPIIIGFIKKSAGL